MSHEFLVNTQSHARNQSYRIIVRDLLKHVNVHQFPGGQLMRPQTIQILSNGHLVIGYSKTRPYYFDFWNEEGLLYNKIESDADKCFVLKNGLFIEIGGKQTIVKQILPEFKMPRIVQVFDFMVQWIDVLGHDILVAQRTDNNTSLLYLLSLQTSSPLLIVPIFITNLQLQNAILHGTTSQGEFIERIDLNHLLESKHFIAKCAPINIRRHKVNEIQLFLINDRYTLLLNNQKQHVRDVGQTIFHLVDWNKHESIWNSTQDISIVATSPDGYFVYCDNDHYAYFLVVCGSSLAVPIPSLSGLKPKGESKFMSNGHFIFHGEKRVMVLDLDNSKILAQYDVTRNTCELMTLSRWNYRPKPKPTELLDFKEDEDDQTGEKETSEGEKTSEGERKGETSEKASERERKEEKVIGKDVSDAKHVAEIQMMVEKSVVDKATSTETPSISVIVEPYPQVSSPSPPPPPPPLIPDKAPEQKETIVEKEKVEKVEKVVEVSSSSSSYCTIM